MSTQPGTPSGCERIAYVVVHREDAAFSDTYGGGGDVVGLDCHLVRPTRGSAAASDTVLVFMHPTGGGMYLPVVSALAAAGHHVLWANSRYRGTDSALIMEKVVADLGRVIVDARDRLGYEHVVLAGWSEGADACRSEAARHHHHHHHHRLDAQHIFRNNSCAMILSQGMLFTWPRRPPHPSPIRAGSRHSLTRCGCSSSTCWATRRPPPPGAPS